MRRRLRGARARAFAYIAVAYRGVRFSFIAIAPSVAAFSSVRAVGAKARHLAVAMILEQLGMVSAGDGMQPAQPEGATAMGANPGQSAELPPDAVPLAGPLDPSAGQAMGDAGQQARVRASRVGRLASLLRGPR